MSNDVISTGACSYVIKTFLQHLPSQEILMGRNSTAQEQQMVSNTH